jgi:hypothetical protein
MYFQIKCGSEIEKGGIGKIDLSSAASPLGLTHYLSLVAAIRCFYYSVESKAVKSDSTEVELRSG